MRFVTILCVGAEFESGCVANVHVALSDSCSTRPSVEVDGSECTYVVSFGKFDCAALILLCGAHMGSAGLECGC